MVCVDESELECLAGGGACGELARAVDWSKTPLGPVTSWSVALKGLTRMVLRSHHPMNLMWGPEHIQIYNDAIVESFGDSRHPMAMGRPAAESWPDTWPLIGKELNDVYCEG